ncbi:MAG: hypothetical protein D6776_02595 [Planctomycetota bacterium]|nr:MAG: hypothetical protein D6776_02595 [Planctomycetota bacterium]
MDELKRNGFWIGMGVAALAAIVFWFVAVGGLEAETKKAQRKVGRLVRKLEGYAGLDEKTAADPERGLPEKPIVRYWERLEENLDKERREIEAIYRKRDAAFERVFTADSRGEFTLANFVTALRRAVEKEIEGKYGKLLPEGKRVSEVFPIAEPPPQDEQQAVIAQKKFYIGRAIARAAHEAHAQQIDGVEFQFAAAGEQTHEGDRDEKESRGIRVDRHHVECTLRLRARHLPVLFSALLKDGTVLFTIDDVKLEKLPFDVSRYAPWNLADKMAPGAGAKEVVSLSDDVYIGDCDESKPESKQPPPPLEEPAVQVVLGLSVLDFDLPRRERRR